MAEWIADAIVGRPEAGMGVTPSFDERVAGVGFVDVQNRTIDLVRTDFAPPAFVPLPRGPAFRCNRPASNIEVTICQDRNLSLLDLRMFEQYSDLDRRTTTTRSREALIDFQRAWIVRRDARCARDPNLVNCLAAEYRSQAERLSDWDPN